MPIPTWVPGQVLASSDVNNWFVPQTALKTSTQSVTSSTTPVNDTQLFLTLPVSTTYYIQGAIFFDAASGGDLKLNFTGPAGATINLQSISRTLGGVAQVWLPLNANQITTAGSGTGTTLSLSFNGVVSMATTAGNIQVVWAQNTSNATATRLFAPSCILATRIG